VRALVEPAAATEVIREFFHRRRASKSRNNQTTPQCYCARKELETLEFLKTLITVCLWMKKNVVDKGRNKKVCGLRRRKSC